MRRYGDPIRRDIRYVFRPGAYAILPRGGAVLLTRQAAPEPDFQLPGGGIEPGESPVAALHREVFEETGWRIGAPRKLGVFRRFSFMPEYDVWAEKVCHIFIARPVRQMTTEIEAGHAAIWASPEVAIGIIGGNIGDRDFLRAYFA